MIVKKILEEEILTFAEVKEILEELKQKAIASGKEMRYEKRKVLSHVSKFAKTDAAKSRELVNELMKLGKMNREIAVRIADLMPKTEVEVRAIYAKERFTLTKEDIERILDCVARYG
ncbi:MAG: RNA polymerase Rpb4 family protein [Canidatus Methanoxibalbensis ujae]|nr:RNA polymerase Rpb4 family protein [Candidatus Methanoxibalbensis ujae]MCW7078569.1 RNA polymerase Rpb4 family protein [Candidatus Methanoxibalbensis ujae]RLG37969.1 MAG: RNA polymerase Rpb4 family protein [Methanosarcinales archaeon]